MIECRRRRNSRRRSRNGAEDAAGIVYRRTDLAGGKPYVGHAKSDARYFAREAEHGRPNPKRRLRVRDPRTCEPGHGAGSAGGVLHRQGGGPTNLSNPDGWLSNWRHQMSDSRYSGAGGDYGP